MQRLDSMDYQTVIKKTQLMEEGIFQESNISCKKHFSSCWWHFSNKKNTKDPVTFLWQVNSVHSVSTQGNFQSALYGVMINSKLLNPAPTTTTNSLLPWIR